MTDSPTLLAEYARNGSESAFRELVTRYLDLVYSTALRCVEGDAHLAEDVAQLVFTDLARKASGLPKDVLLGGWLHRHTCFVAGKVMRGQRRRQARERQAAEMNALHHDSEETLAHLGPILDEAINALGAADRAAILLRFFESYDFRSVGQALGSNEDAAQKRVSRALDKLHSLLLKRGIALSATALGTALAANAVTAAPVGLAATISGTALASATAGGGITLAFFKLIAMTKLKLGVVGAIVVAGLAVPVVLQHSRAGTRLQQTIDLGPYYNASLTNCAGNHAYKHPNHFLEFPQGDHDFGDIHFWVDGFIQLAPHEKTFNKGPIQMPPRVNTIPIGRKCRQIHILHGVVYKADGIRPVAFLELHYRNGTTNYLPVVYGRHVRDWWFRNTPDPVSDPHTEIAWIGSNPHSRKTQELIRVYRTTFENPLPNEVIENFDYVSTLTRGAPFMFAVTVQ